MDYLDDALKLLNSIDEKINSNSRGMYSHRLHYATTLYSIALDHARATCELLKKEICSSAFSLQRATFESYIRGAWIHHCASEKQIRVFTSNERIKQENSKVDIYFSDLVKELEKRLDMPEYLSTIQSNSWSALNSYTHGGMHQVTRYLNQHSIQPNFSNAEKYEVIEFSLILSCFSFSGIADLYNIKNTEQIATELVNELTEWKLKYKSQLCDAP